MLPLMEEMERAISEDPPHPPGVGTVLSAWWTAPVQRCRTGLASLWRGRTPPLMESLGKQSACHTIRVLPPFSLTPSSPSQSYLTAEKDIFLHFSISTFPLPVSHSFHLCFWAPWGSSLLDPFPFDSISHPCKKGPKGLKYKNTWGTLWSWVFPASRLHISRVPFLTLSFSELPRFPLQQGVLQQLTEGTLWILKK